MDSMPCPICGECQWDVDDCALVQNTLMLALTSELLDEIEEAPDMGAIAKILRERGRG